VQNKKVTKFPVILFGRSYWDGLYAWLRDAVSVGGKIGAADLSLLHLTDDVDEVVSLVTGTYSAGEATH
jgi:predicted Rossmann-fold nucleotide-binding protein